MQHKRINSAGKNALQKKAKVLPIFNLAYCYLWRKERWDALQKSSVGMTHINDGF